MSDNLTATYRPEVRYRFPDSDELAILEGVALAQGTNITHLVRKYNRGIVSVRRMPPPWTGWEVGAIENVTSSNVATAMVKAAEHYGIHAKLPAGSLYVAEHGADIAGETVAETAGSIVTGLEGIGQLVMVVLGVLLLERMS